MRASVQYKRGRDRFGDITIESPVTDQGLGKPPVYVRISMDEGGGSVSGWLSFSEARELALALDAAVIIAEHEQKRLEKL